MRYLVTISFTLLTYAAALVSAETAKADTSPRHLWKSYTNVRFQYAICYPEDLLHPQGESPSSDGQKFLARDGAQLIVFGQNNALSESLRDALADTSSRLAGAIGRVTYKVARASWFVVSGQNGKTIFYAKTLYSHDQFKSFELTYNQTETRTYEPLIAHLAGCFVDLAH